MAEAQEEELDYGEEEYEAGEGGEEETEEDMARRISEFEDELTALNKESSNIDQKMTALSGSMDEHSVYIGQVDYSATIEEIRAHFSACGTINRITIMTDKHTGQPKGFAYVEFVEKEGVDNALKLDDTTLKGRQLKVLPKRQNLPAQSFRGRGRGRGSFTSPRGRGGYSSRGGGFSGYSSRGRGGFRGGRSASPYRGGGRSSYRGGRGGYY